MGLGLLSGADWGKVGGKVNESSGGDESYGPPASTPKTFPRQTAAAPRHGDSAAAPPNEAKIWTAGTSQRRSLLVQGLPGRCSPTGTPPAEAPNAKPYHGCHARLPGQHPAPCLRRIIRRHQGSYTFPLRLSHSPVPATTEGSVEPHTHHRRPSHASVALGPRATWGATRGRIVPGRALSPALAVDIEAHARLSQTPDSRSSTPDLWAWGNVA